MFTHQLAGLDRLAGPVQIAQLVTADSYLSTPYCLPIPSAKFPSIGGKLIALLWL